LECRHVPAALLWLFDHDAIDASMADLYRSADRCREKLSPQQVEFVHLVFGRYRGNVTRASATVGITPKTGWKWRDHVDVKAYGRALMRIEAAKLFVNRTRVVGEVVALGMINMADVQDAWREAAIAAAQESEARALVSLDPGDDDAHQRPSDSIQASLYGSDLIARLPPNIGKAVRKVKFDVVHVEHYEYDHDARKPVLVRKGPVTVLSELEVHDKLKALALLGEWFGMEPGSLSEDGGAQDDGFKGHTIVAPERAE